MRLSDLTVFPKQVKRHYCVGFREHTPFAKTQRTPSLARYALLQAYAPIALSFELSVSGLSVVLGLNAGPSGKASSE
ncbi:hypothetical protein ACJ2_20420 [Pantoea sp. QMID2]|nr:hypothetical protein ACJ3_12820 [Pantoea sp. QMID3]GME34365.1 hypothetical protein ACJ1_12740 [Pantoea sp. QMID1]GME55708.1 hypothetical protein ACJ4_20400 [Pantoea sp. QMID4]GME56740.1 hypothetical protein ACJ2_20420 [Pantoea sp. QMID2]